MPAKAPQTPQRKHHRGGIIRRLGVPRVGIWALAMWLSGGLLFPLLHQLDHHQPHSHASSRVVRWGKHQIGRFAIRPHTHKPHAHTHHKGANKGNLWLRARRWLAHLWSHTPPRAHPTTKLQR